MASKGGTEKAHHLSRVYFRLLLLIFHPPHPMPVEISEDQPSRFPSRFIERPPGGEVVREACLIFFEGLQAPSGGLACREEVQGGGKGRRTEKREDARSVQ